MEQSDHIYALIEKKKSSKAVQILLVTRPGTFIKKALWNLPKQKRDGVNKAEGKYISIICKIKDKLMYRELFEGIV